MKRTYQIIILVAIALFAVACGGEDVPLTEPQINATRQANATQAVADYEADRDKEVQALVDLVEQEGLEGVVVAESIPDQGHNDSMVYPWGGTPPDGGEHNGTWQKCGIYEQPVYAHHAIHAMEHGALWVTYHPDLDEDSVETLTELSQKSFMLLSPYYEQSENIAITGWGVQYVTDSADDPMLEEFVRVFRNGLQTREKGATCAQGTTLVAETLEGEVLEPLDGESME